MFPPPDFFPLLTDVLPFSSNIFMVVMVGSAATASIIVVFNVLSMKHRATSRWSVASIMLLLAAWLSCLAALGLSYQSGSLDLFDTVPGVVSVVLAVAAMVLAVIAMFRFTGRHRIRKGSKRAIASLVFSILFLLCFYAIEHRAKHPVAPASPKTKVEYIEEATPAPRPAAAPIVQAPAATPEPSPATPRPSGLPSVIAPN